jgi:hypothetical protein
LPRGQRCGTHHEKCFGIRRARHERVALVRHSAGGKGTGGRKASDRENLLCCLKKEKKRLSWSRVVARTRAQRFPGSVRFPSPRAPSRARCSRGFDTAWIHAARGVCSSSSPGAPAANTKSRRLRVCVETACLATAPLNTECGHRWSPSRAKGSLMSGERVGTAPGGSGGEA